MIVINLKFVHRPSASVVVSALETIAINCTAELAPNIPASTRWIFPHEQCGLGTAKRTVLHNGTLVIRGATAWDSATYVCYVGAKSILSSVQLKVAGKQ